MKQARDELREEAAQESSDYGYGNGNGVLLRVNTIGHAVDE